MSGQHILASFLVIILSQVYGTLCTGSSFGHAPLCFHALIGCFRKEGCISLILPASCCVQQQFIAPPPPSMWNQEVSSYRTLLFCRGIFLLNTSAERHLVSFTVFVTHILKKHKLIHLHNGDLALKTEAAVKALCYRPPVGWCALECNLIIEAAHSVRPSSPQT